MTNKYKNILVIRNDKLGDFMLAWPALSLLKKQYPEATITALVPAYTVPMAEICPSIDNCLIDERHKSAFTDIQQLHNMIRSGNFDAVITFFSEFRTGIATWMAGIPVRVAPATKIARVFYNHKLVQRRSKSEKPEYMYNIDLSEFFIHLENPAASMRIPSPPYLWFDKDEIETLKNDYLTRHEIDKSRKLVFFHPGTGGSAINLSLEQYSEIANKISGSWDCHMVITAGPDELQTANKLSKLFGNIKHTVYHSTRSIVTFSKFLAISDLFISGSTGPLHISGALNRPTVAFYPARRSATPLRWQTINQKEYRLAISPDKHIDENDMQTIDSAQSADLIIDFAKSIYH